MILDVGCGANPKGDVNTDLFTGKTPHSKYFINPKKIKNFVLCDAHFLPFNSKIFDKVYLFEVIEHLENSAKALKESYRVCKKNGYILIGTPNCMNILKILRVLKSGIYSPYESHIATYGIPEMTNLLEYCGFNDFIIKTTSYRGLSNSSFIIKLLLLIFKNVDESILIKVIKND
jgi:ubiquinone/menaquinone biosynthesis C-methylase UbiE